MLSLSLKLIALQTTVAVVSYAAMILYARLVGRWGGFSKINVIAFGGMAFATVITLLSSVLFDWPAGFPTALLVFFAVVIVEYAEHATASSRRRGNIDVFTLTMVGAAAQAIGVFLIFQFVPAAKATQNFGVAGVAIGLINVVIGFLGASAVFLGGVMLMRRVARGFARQFGAASSVSGTLVFCGVMLLWAGFLQQLVWLGVTHPAAALSVLEFTFSYILDPASVIAVVVYCLPTLVAFYRGVPGKQDIVLLNIPLGWTIIAWFAALRLAVTLPKAGTPPAVAPPPT